MRVLVVTNMWPHEAEPSFGTFVAQQVAALRRRGVEIDVLFINGKRSRWNYLLGIPRLWRALLRHRYDLLHAHYVFSGWVARMQLACPVVVSFHGGPEITGYQGVLSRILARLVDGCTVPGQKDKARLRWPAARVVPCGVDLERFSPRPRDEARRRLGLALEDRLVLFVGEARVEKRLDLIEAAVGLVQAEDPRVVLLKVSGQPHELVPWYMNAGDVLVLASDIEASPVVIKEAMACNLPIVSTDVGDVREVLGDTEGCFLCEHTSEDMAAKIRAALAWGRRTRGRERVSHLQVADEVEGILQLYGAALKGRGDGPAATGIG